MAMSVEWRLRDGADAFLLLDSRSHAVSAVCAPDEGILKSFLRVTGTLDAWQGWSEWCPLEAVDQNPERWGELVLSRADNGDVISIDPELYWQGIYRWFRSRGRDYS